ncbi:uncharacterized protein LOC134666114 [Cydia fagiglandana]|uniref:uncharacterized protein LOC134666114 n=1 Tax=Cydia fagiglandana TaxID=1458189 RepID=UPI002FEE2321
MSHAFNVSLEASLSSDDDCSFSSKNINKADINTLDACVQPDNILEDLVIQEGLYEPRKLQSWQGRRKGFYAPRRFESRHGMTDIDHGEPSEIEKEKDINDKYGLQLQSSVAIPKLSTPTNEQDKPPEVKNKLTTETDSVIEKTPHELAIKSFEERFFAKNQSESINDIIPLGKKVGVNEARNLFATNPKPSHRMNIKKPTAESEKQLTSEAGYDSKKESDDELDRNKFKKLLENKSYNDRPSEDIPEKSNSSESDLELTTYELEKYTRNEMIIFNHENFISGPKRRGTALDVAALESTFKQFRFDVTTHNDLTVNDLFTELKKFSRRDFSARGCLCVAILTHGQDHGYLTAFDTRYCERDVIACFDARLNPTLVAKPIIFLIQACRGPQPASVVEAGTINVHDPIQTVELDAVLPTEKYRRPMDSDIIMFHSSFFGRASIRVIEEGTWFIQTLCVQIRLHAATDHFEKLCRRVRTIVAHMEYEGAKQMPVVTSTLLKKLYLKKTLSSLDKSEKSKEEKWQNELMETLSRMPRRRKKFDRISLVKAPEGSTPRVIGVFTDRYQTLHVTY